MRGKFQKTTFFLVHNKNIKYDKATSYLMGTYGLQILFI